MHKNILMAGKERQIFTDYINKLIISVRKLYDEINSNKTFIGKITMIGDKILIIEFHKYLLLNIVFEKEPNQAEISFVRKALTLTTIKLGNDKAIEFIKRILNDEIVVIEHSTFLTTIFPSLFIKVWPKEKYEKNKNKYLNRKNYKIYISSKIIQ